MRKSRKGYISIQPPRRKTFSQNSSPLFGVPVPLVPSYNKRCLTLDPKFDKVPLVPCAPDVEATYNIYLHHDWEIRNTLYKFMWEHFQTMLNNNIHNRIVAIINVSTVAYDKYIRQCLDHDCRPCGEHYGMRFIITTREQIENVLFISITKYRRVYRREIPGVEEFSNILSECQNMYF